MSLARKPYVVIDAEILSSSIWSEDAHTKLVWLTLLILCDTEGYVGAAVPGIARAVGIPLQDTQRALEILQQPDPHSRTQANEGRRLEVAERGFRILNFREHLDRLSAERRKTRDRVRRFRERAKKRGEGDGNVTVPTGNREVGSREVGNRESTDKRIRSASRRGPKAEWPTKESIDDWIEATGGVPPAARIVKALTALVRSKAREHGLSEAEAWARIRPAWQKYLQTTQAGIRSPEHFARDPRQVVEGKGRGSAAAAVLAWGAEE